MSLPMTIENEFLRVEVYPHFGGKVLSIVDKADEYELLFDYPSEFPTAPAYDKPYGDSYYAGWDECFPAVASGPYPSHPYTGITIPDHGELWGIPAAAVPMRQGISTEWHGLRFGYTLSRKLWLDGPSLIAEYVLSNLAPFDFHFVWAMHALSSLHAPVELELPPGSYRLSHDAEGRQYDQTFTWPMDTLGEDLSRPLELAGKIGRKVFSVDAIGAPAVVRYPTRRGGRSLRIEYSSPDQIRAYWGVWINTGGWQGHRHFAIEPTTGRFDQLDRSLHDGSAARVPAGGKASWAVRWTVGSLNAPASAWASRPQ